MCPAAFVLDKLSALVGFLCDKGKACRHKDLYAISDNFGADNADATRRNRVQKSRFVRLYYARIFFIILLKKFSPNGRNRRS